MKSEVGQFNDWLATLKTKHKIVVAGNHDFSFEETPELARSWLTNCIYLQDSSVTVEGLTFYGSPWTPTYYGVFNRDRGEPIKEIWDQIPQGLDVLITHSPPHKILDKTCEDIYAGCEELALAVERVKPRVHVFGHIHESKGQLHQGGVHYINAASCNLRYKIVNEPIIIELEVKEPISDKIDEIVFPEP